MAASKGREAKSNAEFVACVVGLSRGAGEAFSSHSGVGKSCLCHRFVYPGFDDYVDDHQSVFALHEFESSEINRDHFLYWGSIFKHFPVKSSKNGSHAIIQVHVIEQTVFYQDETSEPFPNSGNYRKRIVGSLESLGKVSYKSRNDLDLSSDTQQYPSKKLNKVPRGYMVVVDISQIGVLFDAQLERVEQVLEYLTKHKHKFVIVVSKRDDSNPNSLRCAHELKRKYHALLIETSASGNINVRDAFRLLAHKVLKKSLEISDSITSYEDAQHRALKARGYVKRTFQEFLKKQITDPEAQLHSLCEYSEFKECKKLTGRFDTGWLFATHILQLCNNSYSDIEDNRTVTKREYLEKFIKERPDLSFYLQHLKSWIEYYMVEDQADIVDVLVEEDEEEEAADKLREATDMSTARYTDRSKPNYHAWVTIIETPSTRNSRPSSAVCSETASHRNGSVSSANSDLDDDSVGGRKTMQEFDPEMMHNIEQSNCSSIVQHTTDDSRPINVNSETLLGTADKESHGNENLGKHNYELVDDLPMVHPVPTASTHISLMPPVKVKVNAGIDQKSLIAKVPTSMTEQCTSPDMATHTAHEYENHTLNFQHHNRVADHVSLPPRSHTAHCKPLSLTATTTPRQEINFERKNFSRLDTPRTLLAKKLENFQGISATKSPTPDANNEQPKGEECASRYTTTHRHNYENHTLTSEHQNEGVNHTSLPPRSQTTTMHTHGRPPISVINTASRQETIVEGKDFRQLEAHWKLLDIQSEKTEISQECARKIPTPDSSTGQPKAEEHALLNTATRRPNYENHTLSSNHHDEEEDCASLPPRSLPTTHTHGGPHLATFNGAPRQDIAKERTNFARLATPSTLRKCGVQSGKPTTATPDYVDDDYVNTALLSISNLPSPTTKSGSTVSATPDYVDDDYINTALISQSDRQSSVSEMDSDYVNPTPPMSLKRGVRPLPLTGMDDEDDELVYDYPDMRNSRLLLSPTSLKIHQAVHFTKLDPLGNNSTTSPPHRTTKARATSDASNTRHLITATKAVTGVGHQPSNNSSAAPSDVTTVTNVPSTNSMSRQDSSDYINGYVNTGLQSPLSRTRNTSEHSNAEKKSLDSDKELEYDYPNIERIIRFNFGGQQHKKQRKLTPLPPRKGNNSRTTFTSKSAPETSLNQGNSISNMNTPLPKWWLELIEERERMRNNPELQIYVATGRRRSCYQPATILPPRTDLQATQEQHHQNALLDQNGELFGIDRDEYIVMASAGCTVDDSYVNWETIYSARQYLSPHVGHATNKKLPPRGVVARDAENLSCKKYSIDDIEVTYAVTPPCVPIALPPRGVRRIVASEPDKSKSECDSEKRSSIIVSPQAKPQVKPKPACLKEKQKNGSLSHLNSKGSELKPPIKPKPKLKLKPTLSSTKPVPLTRKTSLVGGGEGVRSQPSAESNQLQHQEGSLSLNHLTNPPIPAPRSPRHSDHSAPSELALKKVAK